MISAASPAKIEANRCNAMLSAGPVTDAGKINSSRNSLSHGLTAKHPVLPGESEDEYREFADNYVRLFPTKPELAAEYASLRWRERRVPAFEARIISLEVEAILNDPELEPIAANRDSRTLEALAFMRLVERKVLTNLYSLENRLQRRATKIFADLAATSTTTPAATPAPMPRTTPPPAEQQIPKNEPTAPAPKPSQTVVNTNKVGRNEACPCGSHLKYKRCCGNPLLKMAS